MMKIVLIALLGYATARPQYSGDELAPDAEAFMSYVREYQRIFAHTANHAQLQTIFENRPMSDYINGVLGHGDGRIEAFEFNQWHAAVADLWRRFGMPGQEVIAEEWAVTDTNKDGHITPVEIYTMLRDEKAAKYFPAFFALMFAEHAKGQPFWSQAKAEDFRRNTPWADVYALPAASTAELLSEEEAVKKEEGDIKAKEFANAMGLLSAEPEPAAIAVLPLKGGAEDVAVIPVRLPEEAANEEAATGVQQTFISSNTPILGVDGVRRLALEYMHDNADPNAPAPPPPMPNAPIDVTMPDNSIVKLLAAPVDEQPTPIQTAAEEGNGAAKAQLNEAVIEKTPGALPMELPVAGIASDNGETTVDVLQPSGKIETFSIQEPANVQLDGTGDAAPTDLMGNTVTATSSDSLPETGRVVAVEKELEKCVEKDGTVAECAKVTIQFPDGRTVQDVPVVVEEPKVGAIVISAHGQKETIEAQVTQSDEGATIMKGVDSTGKEITLEFRPPTNEKITKALQEDNAQGANGGRVDVTITDPSGNVLAETKAIISEVNISQDQKEEDIRMGTDINGQHVDIVAQLPVEAPKENQETRILQAEVTLPGEHVPQPATVLLPPAGVTEELRVAQSEIEIFEHGAGQPASGQIIPLGPMGQMAGLPVPFVQLGQDEARNNADGTVTTDQKFITQDGKTLEVITVSTGPLNDVPTPAPQ